MAFGKSSAKGSTKSVPVAGSRGISAAFLRYSMSEDPLPLPTSLPNTESTPVKREVQPSSSEDIFTLNTSSPNAVISDSQSKLTYDQHDPLEEVGDEDTSTNADNNGTLSSSESSEEKKMKEPTEKSFEQFVLNHGTSIIGSVVIDGSALIDGYLEGPISAPNGSILITERAEVVGDITAQSAVIFGTVTGTALINGPLILKGSSVFTGRIITEGLKIEEGAVFQGACEMRIGNNQGMSEPPCGGKASDGAHELDTDAQHSPHRARPFVAND